MVVRKRLQEESSRIKCKVKRDGKLIETSIDEIVVGDIVKLETGDKIPADGVLCSGAIAVDNSALNGESEECKKYAIPNDFIYREVAITGDTFVDKHSLFRGAVVVNGEGVLEVKKVGMMTMMGEMAKDMQDDDVESPLKVKLSKLADSISKFGYIGAVVIAITLMIHKVIVAGGVSPYFDLGMMYVFKDLLEVLMLAVVIIVMAVPEGLPLSEHSGQWQRRCGP